MPNTTSWREIRKRRPPRASQTAQPERAPSSVFHLPVDKIRSGYYSDAYFNRTKELVEECCRDTVVKIQVFQKNHAVLGGIDEAIAILRECSGEPDHEAWRRFQSEYVPTAYEKVTEPYGNMFYELGWDKLTVHALHETDEIIPYEPVLTIEGPYRLFAHLETVYLGVLARRTLIGTNVRKVLAAANGKPILYFPARHDHWVVQAGDGYTAHLAGVEGVSTDAQATWWGGKGMGTVPHALIAAFGGNTVEAALTFARKYGHDTNVSVLVDFDNDCAQTAVDVAHAFEEEELPLWGVRLDTSDTLVDYGLIKEEMGQFKPTGVCPELVHLVRRELDINGFGNVRIIASGGFSPEKISAFEAVGVPVDSYGVGSSLLRGSNDFTADVVVVDGEPCAKVGRQEIPSTRLELVK